MGSGNIKAGKIIRRPPLSIDPLGEPFFFCHFRESFFHSSLQKHLSALRGYKCYT
jgi:hypothetical protein